MHILLPENSEVCRYRYFACFSFFCNFSKGVCQAEGPQNSGEQGRMKGTIVFNPVPVPGKLPKASLRPTESFLRREDQSDLLPSRGNWQPLHLAVPPSSGEDGGRDWESGRHSQVDVILISVQILISFRKTRSTGHQKHFAPFQSRVHLERCRDSSTSGCLLA